jgi:peroxiredoxin
LDSYFVRTDHPDFTKIKELINVMTGNLLDRTYISELNDWIEQNEKLKDGSVAPYFSVKSSEGKMINRSAFTEKYLLLHFWASWDQASRRESAGLRDVYRKYKKKKNFDMVSYSLDIDSLLWKKAIKQDSLTWKQLSDFSSWESPVVKQYAVHSLPSTFLIDPNSKIIARDIKGDSLIHKLQELLSE